MRRFLSVLVAAGATSLVAALPVRAEAQIADGVLFERVAEAVLTYPQYGVFDSIDVKVEGQVVTLSGRVTNPRKKNDIEGRVRKVEGVRSLTSEIGVLPVSPADDTLRYKVASSIYNHPMFWIHGQRPVPPIHIVVERGQITLTGVADSEAQRAMAGSLAQIPGGFSVTNRIRVAKR